MRVYAILFLILLASSCVILKKKEYDNLVQNSKEANRIGNAIKSQVGNQVTSPTNVVCDLTFLLRTLSQKFKQLEGVEIDEDRINLIKNELFKANNDILTNSAPVQMTIDDFKIKLVCYLDYMIDPKNKSVPFWKFWEDSYYRQFNCK